jgi:hypothetical protein
MLQYFGVFAPPPAEEVVSPNGDGVAEEQSLSFKVVRPSTVTATLTAPDGTIAFQETTTRDPGSYEVPFPPPIQDPPPPEDPTQPPPTPVPPGPPAEGRWMLSLSSTDDQGLPSTAVRRFAVNSTIGFLRLEPARLLVRPKGAALETIRWTQSRPARVRVTVETVEGVLIRIAALRRFEAGAQSVTWNGRQRTGKPAATGAYVVRVEATNEHGAVALEQRLVVRRVRGSAR